MHVLTASEMALLDRQTIDQIGIPGIVLMENAARGAADFFLRVLPDLPKRRIAVVAGAGNNAGDGFVLARIFHNRGAAVRVVCLRSPDRLQGDALTNFRILEKMDVPVVVWDEGKDFNTQWHWIAQSDAVIDAILGTGIEERSSGALSADYRSSEYPFRAGAGSGCPVGARRRHGKAAGQQRFGPSPRRPSGFSR